MKPWASLVIALMFTATVAHANPLPPGSTVAPDLFLTPVTGPFLANTGTVSFSGMNSLGQVTISGTFAEVVYADPNNLLCAGCLDFLFHVSSNTTSIDNIGRITQASFGTFLTDVGFTIGTGSVPVPGGVLPTTVDRLGAGNVIGFNFLSGVAPGMSTATLEIETNAKSFTTGTLQIIDGNVASVSVYAPAAVPLPASAWLLLSGLGGLGWLLRRRRSGAAMGLVSTA